MAAIIHPLLTLLASLSRRELVQQVTYLKTGNKLRSKSFTSSDGYRVTG